MALKNYETNLPEKDDPSSRRGLYLVLAAASVVLCFLAYYFEISGLALVLALFSVGFLIQYILMSNGSGLSEFFFEDLSNSATCPKCGASLRPSNRSLFSNRIIANSGRAASLSKCPKCGYEIAANGENKV